MKYIDRISDKQLEKMLRLSGAVLVSGVKWCGKTTSSRKYANSEVILDNSDEGRDFIARANAMPVDLLDRKAPLLIDEWQNAPRLWDAVRREVDRRGEKGQFILTGSSTPLSDEARNEIFHSGFGRIAHMRMHTLSSFESGFSYGKVSLSQLFKDGSIYISEHSDRIRQLERAIEALPPQQKKVAESRRKGYSNREIAEMLNLSLNTVNIHYRLGLKTMKEKMKKPSLAMS